ncbi:EAL and HDOD domain-containing protein [Inmirania thermothiophila]|uniref:Diguanylate phosphodiesterase n=1 Tax=Inmirania thermothiophila TaxID=1750597 RepID=A0A3N1Y688_9GAMM|nr:HDOD domain-containing protein [Inmirania thermothiophila]ROR34270.1 diguanylate phosphodiesterase [Inmirania thermothiophila]
MEFLVARQPIYDADLRVRAYELLYRRGPTAAAEVEDGDAATGTVLAGLLMEVGLERLAGTLPAFVNVTPRFVVGGGPVPLPPGRVVLEVLETVDPTAEVLAGLETLRRAGHRIALDDYVLEPERAPLLRLADIVKVDVLALDAARVAESARALRPLGVELLAEKVEDRETFERCRALGFELFQGYFFARPDLMRSRRAPAARTALMRLIARLQDPEAGFDELAGIVRSDVTLGYRLLRYINSAFFGLRVEVDSIERAMIYLGERNLRGWATVLALASVDDKPSELLTTSLVRARMTERLASRADLEPQAAFTAGLLSTVDAYLDQPMEAVVEALPLTAELRAALARHEGPLGTLLAGVLAYERGDWARARTLLPETAAEIYVEALDWADRVRAGLLGAA